MPGRSRSQDRSSTVADYPDREVDLDDELTILPDQTRDDTDLGWGEVRQDNDRRLLEDRPPHWG
ncbi:MAG: hypothetical protein WCA46_10960 [Actinocatenispora sp.]